MRKIPGRAWECEVTDGDRVFYVPDPTQRSVEVYYAGEHPVFSGHHYYSTDVEFSFSRDAKCGIHPYVRARR